MRKSLAALCALTSATFSFAQVPPRPITVKETTKAVTENRTILSVDAIARADTLRFFPGKKKPKPPANENDFGRSYNMPVPALRKGDTYQVIAQQPGGSNGPLVNTRPLFDTSFTALVDDGDHIPPDCSGAVGPNYIVTALNSQVRVQKKTGVYDKIFSLENFFSLRTGVADAFDPRILYDADAKRWVIMAATKMNSDSSGILLAVSLNEDPLEWSSGFYYKSDPTNKTWFDYPIVGINKTWLVISGNMFTRERNVADAQFVRPILFIFDKTSLYGGNSNVFLLKELKKETGFSLAPASSIDFGEDEPLYLVSTLNTREGGKGFLQVYKIDGFPDAPGFTKTEVVPSVNVTWSYTPTENNADFSPQKDVPKLIQNNDSRMQNAVYASGFVWCTHTAFIPTDNPHLAVVQWYQLDPGSGRIAQFGRIADAPNFLAFPSIAVNQSQDVLIGFSSFAGNKFASASYAFRSHLDPPGFMQLETVFKEGSHQYYKVFSSTRNRWGDYSTTVVDPVDSSFWTLQQYATDEDKKEKTDRWSTQWLHIKPRH
jgi:hypothetical protein